ncbi:hypothetical protein ACLOJK_040420 [Asimina triloba]
MGRVWTPVDLLLVDVILPCDGALVTMDARSRIDLGKGGVASWLAHVMGDGRLLAGRMEHGGAAMVADGGGPIVQLLAGFGRDEFCSWAGWTLARQLLATPTVMGSAGSWLQACGCLWICWPCGGWRRAESAADGGRWVRQGRGSQMGCSLIADDGGGPDLPPCRADVDERRLMWRWVRQPTKMGKMPFFWVLDFHVMAVLLLEDDNGIEFSMFSPLFWVAWIGRPHRRREARRRQPWLPTLVEKTMEHQNWCSGGVLQTVYLQVYFPI